MSSRTPESSESDQPGQPGPALARLATALCLTGTVAFLALFAVALYRFRFGLSPKALAWYGLALAGVLITLLVARSRATTRVLMVLVGMTVGITLLSIELGLEFLERRRFVRIQEAVERHSGVPFDRRTVREVVRDLRSQGTSAIPSVVPRVILPFTGPEASPAHEFRAPFFPLAGVSRRTTVQLCIEGGRFPIYQSDEHGFLNPPGTWRSSPELVVLIGDSFVHGYCVPPDSTLGAHLRLIWPHVLSLGTGGSGPLTELATITEYAAPMTPSLVLWMYSENDLPDLTTERQNPTLRRYLEKEFCQRLRLRQPEIDSTLSQWVDRLYAAQADFQGWGQYSWRRTLVLAALRNRLVAGSARGTGDAMAQLELFEQVLREADRRVAGWRGQLVFVFLPAWERLFDSTVARNDETRAAVLEAARRRDIPIVDLTPVFTAHANPESLFSRGRITGGHYSSRGYSLVAQSIASGLSRLVDSLDRSTRATNPTEAASARLTAAGCLGDPTSR